MNEEAVMGQFEDAEPMLQRAHTAQHEQHFAAEQPQPQPQHHHEHEHVTHIQGGAGGSGGQDYIASATATAASAAAAATATHHPVATVIARTLDQMSAHYAAEAYATYEDALQQQQQQQQQQEQEQPHQQQQQQQPQPHDLLPNGTATTAAAAAAAAARKKRICKFPGCNRVVKSQGHCQGHGAKAKRCSVEGCDKQAQATHEGMCKRHWRLKYFPNESAAAAAAAGESSGNAATASTTTQQEVQEPPKSVYETVLPQSIAFRPTDSARRGDTKEWRDPLDPPPAPDGITVMPLVAYLKKGAIRTSGWHRNEERRARGLQPIAVSNLSTTQLEPWERQLAVVEILLLGGGTPYASFKDLAHGWGRRKGFHSALINNVCERRGDIIRKRKSEIGVPISIATPTTMTMTTTKTRTTARESPAKQQKLNHQNHQHQAMNNNNNTNHTDDNYNNNSSNLHQHNNNHHEQHHQQQHQQQQQHQYEGLPEGYDPNDHQVI